MRGVTVMRNVMVTLRYVTPCPRARLRPLRGKGTSHERYVAIRKITLVLLCSVRGVELWLSDPTRAPPLHALLGAPPAAELPQTGTDMCGMILSITYSTADALRAGQVKRVPFARRSALVALWPRKEGDAIHACTRP